MSTNWSVPRVRVPRFAEVAVERARLTVVPPTRSKAPTAPFIILVMAMLIGGVIGLLAFNTNMQAKAFETTRLQDEANKLQAQQQRLMLELEELRNPQTLAQKAKRMGMIPPTAPAFLRLQDGRVLGDSQSAVAGSGIQINPNPAGKPAQLTPKRIVVKVPASEAAVPSANPIQGAENRGSAQSATEPGAASQIR
jgi:hypothetical protein